MNTRTLPHVRPGAVISSPCAEAHGEAADARTVVPATNDLVAGVIPRQCNRHVFILGTCFACGLSITDHKRNAKEARRMKDKIRYAENH